MMSAVVNRSHNIFGCSRGAATLGALDRPRYCQLTLCRPRPKYRGSRNGDQGVIGTVGANDPF